MAASIGFSDIVSDYVKVIVAKQKKEKKKRKALADTALIAPICPLCSLRPRVAHAEKFGGYASYCAECLAEKNHSYYLKKRKHHA